MGIWAGIKYALNSTLGTSGFKSLDKLIIETVKEYNRYVLIPSEDVISEIDTQTVVSTTTLQEASSHFKMKTSGSFKIGMTWHTSSGSGYSRTLNIYKNSELIVTLTPNATGTDSVTYTVPNEIFCKEDDIISFAFKNNSSSANTWYIDTISMLADKIPSQAQADKLVEVL